VSCSPAPGAKENSAQDFTAERRALAALAALLTRERETLLAGDLETLACLAAEKEASVEALERLLAERFASLGGEGAPPDVRTRHNAWLARQPDTVRAAWGSLLAEAARLRDLNRLNGRLIDQRLALCRQGLALLARSGEANLYDQTGRLLPASRPCEAVRA
jgi:flagella synthesis protein FlgN